MTTPSLWSAGRYDAVGERIAHIAGQLCDAVERRRPLRGSDVVDLGCGTGSAALAAAERGAHLTGVDLTRGVNGLLVSTGPCGTPLMCIRPHSRTVPRTHAA